MACNSAKRGTKVANICNSTGGVDVGCADLSSDAITGNLVSATVSGIACPGANCTIKIWYDQIGSACTGPCDATQATVATRPTLTTSCGSLGKAFCAAFSGSQFLQTANLGSSISLPITFSSVAIHTGSGAIHAIVGGALANDAEMFFNSVANQAGVFANNAFAVNAATDNAWHALQGIEQVSSGIMNVDGSNGSASGGATSALSSGNGILLGSDSFAEKLIGSVAEVLIYPIAFSTPGNSVTMCHNQFTRWGTLTSC